MAAELRVLHANVNGIRARKTEIELYLNDTKPTVLLLNETKLCGKPMPRFAGYKTAAVRDRIIEKLQGRRCSNIDIKLCHILRHINRYR